MKTPSPPPALQKTPSIALQNNKENPGMKVSLKTDPKPPCSISLLRQDIPGPIVSPITIKLEDRRKRNLSGELCSVKDQIISIGTITPDAPTTGGYPLVQNGTNSGVVKVEVTDK